MSLGPCFRDLPSLRDEIRDGICRHPPDALFSWYARDDSAPKAQDRLVTVCMACGAVLHGAADEQEAMRDDR